MKATEQYFTAVLFTVLYKVDLLLRLSIKFLQCDRSNKTSR